MKAGEIGEDDGPKTHIHLTFCLLHVENFKHDSVENSHVISGNVAQFWHIIIIIIIIYCDWVFTRWQESLC